MLPGTSTVWEYLTFHARLRLPGVLSDGERAARVQAIVDQLSLGKVRATTDAAARCSTSYRYELQKGHNARGSCGINSRR